MRVLAEDRNRKDDLPNPKSSILKIKGSEIQQATTAAAAGDRRAAGAALPDRSDDAEFGSNEPPDRSRLGGAGGARLFQLPQDHHLRRLQRDPAQHPRQGRAGVLIVIRYSKRSPEACRRHAPRATSHPVRSTSSRMAATLGKSRHGFRSQRRAAPAEGQRRAAARRHLRRSRPAHGLHEGAKGLQPALWQQYADLGLLGVPFAEEHGGLGQGLTETMIIAEAFGQRIGYRALSRDRRARRRRAAPCRQRKRCLQELVPAIVEGRLTLALAHQERQARYDLADTATTARSDGKGGYTLEGEKVRRARRRQRRQADRHGARLGRPRRPQRHRAVPGRCQGQRRDPPRLPHAGRHARRRRHAVGRAGRAGGGVGGSRQGACRAGARGGRGDRGAGRRGGRARWRRCTS